MHPVITITLNPAIDISTSVEALQPDKKLRCAEPEFAPGGGGINVARVLHRFGGDVLPVYLAGGATGKKLTALLAAEGLATSPVEISGETRENMHVSDNSNGRQYRFVLPGPAISFAENLALLEHLSHVMEGAQYVVISGNLPKGVNPEFMDKLVSMAHIYGCRLVADLSGDGLRQATMAGVFLIKPNLGELASLAEKEVLSESEAIASARRIVSAGGASVVAISMGATGALLVTAELEERILAPVTRPVSTVGAGDSMVAGIVWALMKGDTMSAAVRFGVACGTAATLSEGTGLCQKQDAERFYASVQP
ncbi:1-phosphofructokinase family hexose kinase [Chitinophaga pollutisoli]|uniref:1-phosphofructokinase family hexose kinase n=1 Tax=Chitinophaga pollutisoli TaxID=3133966 RepID=A0ABZ2YM05_9BACT